MAELREFRDHLWRRTRLGDLKQLNLLGVQFALCEASKYLFYLRYESGPIYKPSVDRGLTLGPIDATEARRLRAIWTYWEEGPGEDAVVAPEDDLHPDHRVAE